MGFLARIFHGRQYEMDPPQPITVEVTISGSVLDEHGLSEQIRQFVLDYARREHLAPRQTSELPAAPTLRQQRDLALMRRLGWTAEQVDALPVGLRDTIAYWLFRNPGDPPAAPVPA